MGGFSDGDAVQVDVGRSILTPAAAIATFPSIQGRCPPTPEASTPTHPSASKFGLRCKIMGVMHVANACPPCEIV